MQFSELIKSMIGKSRAAPEVGGAKDAGVDAPESSKKQRSRGHDGERLGTAQTQAQRTEIQIARAIYDPLEQTLTVNGWCIPSDPIYDIRVTTDCGTSAKAQHKNIEKIDGIQQLPVSGEMMAGWEVVIEAVKPAEGATVNVVLRSENYREECDASISIARPTTVGDRAGAADEKIELKHCEYSPLRCLLTVEGTARIGRDVFDLRLVSSAGRDLSTAQRWISPAQSGGVYRWSVQVLVTSLTSQERFTVELDDGAVRSATAVPKVTADSTRRQTALKSSVVPLSDEIGDRRITTEALVELEAALGEIGVSADKSAQVCYFPAFDDAESQKDHVRRASWYLTGQDSPIERIVMAGEIPEPIEDIEWPRHIGRARCATDTIEFVTPGSSLVQELACSAVIAIWKPIDTEMRDYVKSLLRGAHVVTLATDDPRAVEYGQYCSVQWQMTAQEERKRLLSLSRRRFRDMLERQRAAGKQCSAVFGTGPSLSKAWDYDLTNALTVVCNSIVGNQELFDHIKPSFICAGDAVSHYGVSRYAEVFREDLAARLKSRDTYLFASAPFGYLLSRKYPEIRDKIIICEQRANGPNFDLENVWSLPRMDSTLNIHMLPIAGTFADTIFAFGLDGKDPNPNNNEDFWAHAESAQYHDLVDSGHEAHPTFAINREVATEERYLASVEESVLAAECVGKFFYSVASSFTPMVHARPVPKHLVRNPHGPGRAKLQAVERPNPNDSAGPRALVVMRVTRHHFSGGRYHATMIAEAMANFCREVVVWSNNVPLWHGELGSAEHHGRVVYHVGDNDVRPEGAFDHVVVVPHGAQKSALYTAALEVARDNDATTLFVNFESPNWFNELSPDPKPEVNFLNWYAAASFCDAILCSAETGVPYAKEYFTTPYHEPQLAVAPPSINNGIADRVVEAMPEKERQVVVIGRFGDLSRHKNMDQLLKMLPEELSGYTLAIIVGTGLMPGDENVDKLQASVEQRGLKLKLLHMISDREKFEEIAKSELMIFPSLFEGFGYPPVEAGYVGTACVAYDLPVLKEFNARSSYFVRSGDADAMRAKVREVLAIPDETKAHRDPVACEIGTIDAFSTRLKAIIDGVFPAAARAYTRERFEFAKACGRERLPAAERLHNARSEERPRGAGQPPYEGQASGHGAETSKDGLGGAVGRRAKSAGAKRVLLSDYGGDITRPAQLDHVLRELVESGDEVYRTSLMPISTVSANLLLPRFFHSRKLHESIEKTKALSNYSKQKHDLLQYCAGLRWGAQPERSYDNNITFCALYHEYITEELNKIKPDLVILWHKFNVYHVIIEAWCKRHGKEVVYCENGVLPGSWCFEYGGQMGESWIAKHPKAFEALPISGNDILSAQAYLTHCARSGLNRKGRGRPLAESGLAEWITADNRPTVLYTGSNDPKTGLVPYDPDVTREHAQEFVDTRRGLEQLLAVARKNDWRIVFKPHPSVKIPQIEALETDPHIALAGQDVDLVELLRYVDAMATIVSQAAYMALIHDKPCVLMGRMQLTGTGLVEEALTSSALEPALYRALNTEFGCERQAAFERHVARLLRYYVVSPTATAGEFFRYGLCDVGGAIADQTPERPGEFSVVARSRLLTTVRHVERSA